MLVVTEQHAGVSFEQDEETRLILDSIDDFIEQEVKPLEDELGETLDNPRLSNEADGGLVPEVAEAADEVRRKSADAGFYAMNMPEEYGGEGVSNVTWYRATRHVSEKGRGLHELMLAGPEGPKPLLLQAEGEQVEKYLEPCIRGEKTTAFGLTEPSVGSDAPSMKTTAEKDGDEWVLNGSKQWITNAPHCDFAQIFARTTPVDKAGRYGGITCFIVESDEFELGSYNNAVGLEGRQAEIILNDVRIPDDRILGTQDGAFYNAMSFLSLGRLELGARAVGLSDGFPLIGYRSIAKNLELTADNAEDIADIALEAEGHALNIDGATMRRIRDFTDQVNEITELAVKAAVTRDYDTAIEVKQRFSDISSREQEILADLPEMSNEQLLQVREVLVSLDQTAQYAVRNAEIATNLALNEESEHITIR